jgi:hypothetical protein
VPRILIATALVAGLAALASTPAYAQAPRGPTWAKVNDCASNAVGMRASLAGDGTQKQMRVRFTAQWYSPQRHAWVPVEGAATSPWLEAGSAEWEWGQTGWTFDFAPSGGRQFQIRGQAEMQWLDGGQVVRSASRVTGTCVL